MPLPVRTAGVNLFALPGRSAEAEVAIWPENLAAFELFMQLETQWNFVAMPTGALVATGLNYLVLIAFIDRLRLPPDDGDALLADVRVMETAARGVMNSSK